MAFCEEDHPGTDIWTKLLDGANQRIGRWDQNLMLVDRPFHHGEPIGKKVAN